MTYSDESEISQVICDAHFPNKCQTTELIQLAKRCDKHHSLSIHTVKDV